MLQVLVALAGLGLPACALAADSEAAYIAVLAKPLVLLVIALIAVPIHWLVRNKLPDGKIKRLLTKKL